MPRYIVTGMGSHGPLQVPDARGPMRLWDVYRMPPTGNTILVYEDGEVVEGWEFPSDIQQDPLVHRMFLGGQKHIVDSVADALSYNSLVDAGYDLVLEA